MEFPIPLKQSDTYVYEYVYKKTPVIIIQTESNIITSESLEKKRNELKNIAD
jgi:hypothetical protein